MVWSRGVVVGSGGRGSMVVVYRGGVVWWCGVGLWWQVMWYAVVWSVPVAVALWWCGVGLWWQGRNRWSGRPAAYHSSGGLGGEGGRAAGGRHRNRTRANSNSVVDALRVTELGPT